MTFKDVKVLFTLDTLSTAQSEQKKTRSLMVRAFVAASATVFGILFSFFFIFEAMSYQDQKKQFEEQFSKVSHTLAWSIESRIYAKVRMFNARYDHLSRRYSLEQIRDIVSNDPGLSAFNYTYFADLNGDMFVHGHQIVDGYDPRIRPWFIKAMESEDTIITEPYNTPAGEFMFTLARKIVSNGEVIGVFGVDVLVSDFATKLNESYAEDKFDLVIFGNLGQVITSSDLNDIGLENSSVFEGLKLGEGAPHIQTISYHGEDMIASLSQIESLPNHAWSIVLFQKNNFSYNVLQRLNSVPFYATLGVAMLIILLSTLVISKLLVKPLHNLRMLVEAHKRNLAKEVQDRTAELELQTLKLEQSLTAERETNQLQNEFVSMVSHELRTPLTIIEASARRIETYVQSRRYDAITEKTPNIRSAVRRLTELVERTLDSSRLVSGQFTLNPDSMNLYSLLEDIIDRTREFAPDHQIHFARDPEFDGTIKADAGLLDHVFTNILSNAVKYSQNYPVVELSLDVEGNHVTIVCKDYGVGVPQKELSRLSQRFFRASTSIGIPGTGIGLNLVKSLVDMHQGHFSIDSKEGEWTKVTIDLPISRPSHLQHDAVEAA